jgi:peptidoglycan/xylan/chitin deacetylase (PgdA/CDA1 family)
MKGLLLSLADLCGFSALFRFFHRGSLTILLYHGVAPLRGPGIYNYRGKFVSPSAFERHMRHFAKHYTILSLDEAVRALWSGRLPKNALAITFDDGYRNFYEHAFPILQRLRIPAAVFLVSDFVLKRRPLWVDRLEYAIGTMKGSRDDLIRRDMTIRDELKGLDEESREKRLAKIEEEARCALADFSGDRLCYAPLTLDEIRQMHGSGITFGAHSRSHPILSKLAPQHVREEVGGSKKDFETLTLSSVFAYPNGQRGDWNEEVERSLAESGYAAALTTIEGFNGAETPRYALRRIAMDGTDDGGAFAAIASGVRLFLRRLFL